VIEEVIPWASRRVGADQTSWLAAGFSNGAAWAIAAAQRQPDIFKGVAAFSAGVVPSRLARGARAERVRHYLAAGVLEPGFRRSTREWAERLERARLEYHHHEWAGGHDPAWWENELPGALAWLIDPANETQT
jgi:enterochelin esterase-like enzyme